MALNRRTRILLLDQMRRAQTRSHRWPAREEALGDEPIMDVAHLGHLELLTPKPNETLRFFVDVMGMTESGRKGDSVFLRAWDDYEQYSLQLTSAKTAALGHASFRTRSAKALERRVHTSDGIEVRSQTICTEATSPTWVTETNRPTTPLLGGAAQCAKFSEMRFFVNLPSVDVKDPGVVVKKPL